MPDAPDEFSFREAFQNRAIFATMVLLALALNGPGTGHAKGPMLVRPFGRAFRVILALSDFGSMNIEVALRC